ncbi:MAG: GNAT family N-acetyltransferase [Pseudomonadota bacterium]
MAREQIRIRAARGDDVAAIGEIVVASWRHTFDGILPRDFLMSMSRHHQKRRHGRTLSLDFVHYVVAVTNDGEVIGFASGGPGRDPDFAARNEIYATYVKPGFERRGIGRCLFASILSALATSKQRGFYLTALAVNPNRSFYAKLGGVETDAPRIRLGRDSYEQVAFVWDDLPTADTGPRQQGSTGPP